MSNTSSPTHWLLLQPAYLLHHRPYRDTSRILELLTREHGRVSVFARGARGAKSALGPVLQPFNRVLASWTVGREAGTLVGAELDGAPQVMPAARMMSGFYLNELLLKLLTPHDPHPVLFDLYAAAVQALKDLADEGRTLRLFEKRLLQELGYGLSLEREAENGAPVRSECQYRYVFEYGVMPMAAHDVVRSDAWQFPGASLLSLGREELRDPASLADARRLLRGALERLLDGRELKSREILRELRQLQRSE